MQRIEPAYPDLLPLAHRLGAVPSARSGPVLDPVDMRLRFSDSPAPSAVPDRSVPRRPFSFLVHARAAQAEREQLAKLLEAGCGALIVVDAPLDPQEIPAVEARSQVVALVPWFPELYGGGPLGGLAAWKLEGYRVGVLLALAPCPEPRRRVAAAVAEAAQAGAEFVLAAPLCLPADERHRAYDRHAGEDGDEELENLLFHSDLGRLNLELEQAASRAALANGLTEGLPGPATALLPAESVWAACQLLLWARRLDALDAMGSPGWQLRRAARALLASRQHFDTLMAEDNLRVIPGFNPWVEAFARGAWGGGGPPFDEVRSRWLQDV